MRLRPFNRLRLMRSLRRSGNDLQMTTHLLQVYTHEGVTFCESRQLVFTFLYRKEHSVTVTILQNEEFETEGTIVEFAWGDACTGGHTLSMTAEISGDDMSHNITESMSTYTSGAGILYVPDNSDDFSGGSVSGKQITESACVPDCTGDITRLMKFGLLKSTPTAILAAQYTFSGTISCYDSDAEVELDHNFSSVVLYQYGEDIDSCAATECEIPVVDSARTVDFLLCDPTSCRVRLTLSDDSWGLLLWRVLP